mmetsp:Transcript_11152/g.16375  ORF Transcript_11152/g.16375 Transcript_11152/m.16375 type:complete len:95 (+) Transcript_11152:2265-2549(+)
MGHHYHRIDWSTRSFAAPHAARTEGETPCSRKSMKSGKMQRCTQLLEPATRSSLKYNSFSSSYYVKPRIYPSLKEEEAVVHYSGNDERLLSYTL